MNGLNPKFDRIDDLLRRRSACVESLMVSLVHLSRGEQFAVLTSRIDIIELEHMAEEMRRKANA